ncbi:hypothetical protein GCM10020366_69950 [Saccharopolyspora gregorii]|uniref:Uncharacterized protein n=1 Tax=Saccharopolyspora gregorii TaxID=33914 RepID=A0ABP6S2M4_9PSEU
MVLREVGERADGEPGATDAAEREGVAGDLHRHVRDAVLDHDGQQRLQIGRLGRGEGAVEAFPGDAGLDGADQPGGVPGGPQRGLQQVAGGGLPDVPVTPRMVSFCDGSP